MPSKYQAAIILVAISSSLASGKVPFCTALLNAPLHIPASGIAISRPALTLAMPEWRAYQSVTTKPWNPSSVFNRPLSIFEF
jgi:hypothetical protein